MSASARWHPVVGAGALGGTALAAAGAGAAGAGAGWLWLVMGAAAGFATSGST